MVSQPKGITNGQMEHGHVESWTWDLLRWDMGKLRQLLQSSVPFCGACAVSTTEEIKEREDTSETDRRDRTQMRQGIQRRVVLELHW